jgi:hypothetical protein
VRRWVVGFNTSEMHEPENAQSGFVARLHRFERAAGLYRPGRSPWVWIGPGINVVGSLVMVMWLGIAYDLGWAATIPSAIVLALFMGAMSAAFLATWEDDAEEDERQAVEALAPRPQPPAAGPEHGAEVPQPKRGPAPAAAAAERLEWEIERPEPEPRREREPSLR